MNISEQFWNASLEELRRGYIEEADYFLCLLCGKKIEKGLIYPEDNFLYEAEKYVRVHIEKAHRSVFDYLIRLDKRLTGLTEHQNNLLRLFYQGKSDGEIQKELGIGSASTIRNHRFTLKEKERQAKIFLTMMELLKEHDRNAPAFVDMHKTARMVDDRYNVTRDENTQILNRYFPGGVDSPLKTFATKEKNKLVILREIAKRFQKGRHYSEKEVNEILKTVYDDFATLRRYLIEYGFLDRRPDGSQYWLKETSVMKGDEDMDRKKELKRLYREAETQAGVYQIRNTKNQKVLVVSTLNLRTINGKKAFLEKGHMNPLLNEEIKEYGPDAFAFEILEVLEKPKDVEYFNVKDALEKLEMKWLDKLQPYGDRGYNKEK